MLIQSIKTAYRKSPDTVRIVLFPAFFILRVLTGRIALRMGVWKLTGLEQHSGNELEIVFSGCEQNKTYWTRIAFGDAVKEQYQGKHWRWRIPAVLRTAGKNADLIVRQHFPARPAKDDWLYVPVSVEGNMEAKLINFSSNSVKGDIRRIKKNGFTYEIVADPVAQEELLTQAYLPHLQARYPGEHSPVTFRQMTGDCQKTEGLFILKDGRRVAGTLLCTKNGTVTFRCPAVLPGCESLIKCGAMQAIYYYATEYFKHQGITRISFGGSRPFFHDGVLAWKRKWGQRLMHSGTLVQHVHLLRDRPGAKHFLSHNPFVTTKGNELTGTLFISGQEPTDASEIKKIPSYVWPGLKRVIVYCFDQIPEAAAELSKQHPIHFRSADELLAPHARNSDNIRLMPGKK